MRGSGVRMQAALDEYAKLLQEKALALPKHQPYLVRRVREFLPFAPVQGCDQRPDSLTGVFSFANGNRTGKMRIRRKSLPWQS